MKMDAIIETIKMLAASQGFYGRLYKQLRELYNCDPEAYEEVKNELESQNFKDGVDMILYFEG